MDRLIIAAVAGFALWQMSRQSGTSGTGGGNGGTGTGTSGTGTGPAPELVRSSVRWDPPVDGEGRARRAAGDPSGLHLTAEVRNAHTWGLRNIEAATGRTVTEASGLTVPPDGIIRLDDRTAIPARFGLGRHRVLLLLDGEVFPLGGQSEFVIAPQTPADRQQGALTIPQTEPDPSQQTGEVPGPLTGNPDWTMARHDIPQWVTDPHAVAMRETV